MLARRLRPASLAACALALVVLAGCSGESPDTKKQGKEEPAREGLAIPVGGVSYEVFLSRELNLRIPEDSAYYKGPEAPKGQMLFAVFVQACNHSHSPQQTAGVFRIKDNQGNAFTPLSLPASNDFAYRARTIGPGQCIPQKGSVAQLGPTGGAMLLFKLPLANTENRPLDLELETGVLNGNRQKRTFQLDI